MTEGWVIGVVVSVAIFLVSHLGLAIWFASKINTKVEVITTAVTNLANDIKEIARLDTRIAILESRTARTELDAREALKAVALVASEK